MEEQVTETNNSEVVTEEPPMVTVGLPASSSVAPSVAPSVSTEVPVVPVAPVVPVVKAKRATSEKQRMNYLAANARRVQILAEANQPSQPPTQSTEVFVAPVKTENENENENEKPNAGKGELSTDPSTDPSTDRVIEEANDIRLTIPRFSVDSPLGKIPPPLPKQRLLCRTTPERLRGCLRRGAPLRASHKFREHTDSPFNGHDKVYHDRTKESLERLILKLEVASKKKQNSLIIIDDFVSSLKDNTLRAALERLICNRRHLRVSVNLRELESIRDELVPMEKHHFQAMYNHVFKPGSDSHQFMFLDPYDGAMHPRFGVSQRGRAIYMTGPRHHAFSETLEYSSRAVIIERTPMVELPREDREQKTIFNLFKGDVFTDMLPDPSGDPILNRTIIPERLRPFNETRIPFMRPRGAMAGGGGRGGGPAVLYDRIVQGANPQNNASVPDSSAEVPPFYRPQPPYTSTQAPASAQIVPSNPMLAMVPRQVRRDTRRFQVPPTVGLGPFISPPPLTRGLFAGPALPPGFVRAPQTGLSEATQSSQSTSQAAPLVVYTPPTPGAATSPNFKSSSSSGGKQVVAQPVTRRELLPEDALSVTNYKIKMLKYPSGGSISRDFDWTSMDTPSQILTKWHNTMRPVVGVTSFGHCSISFDVLSGKFIAIYDKDTRYGPTRNVFYMTNRDYGDDPSKNGLGLLLTDSPNIIYNSDMLPTPFPNVALVAHVRGGVLIDGRNRIALELLATGNQGTGQRQIKYDITRFVDEQNSDLMPYDPSLRFTFLVNSENTIKLFAGTDEIYRPAIRVCGGAIIDGAYSGVISPTSRLIVQSDNARDLSRVDFSEKSIPVVSLQDVYFQAIYIHGKSANGVTVNVVNSIERLEDKILMTEEVVNISPKKDSPVFTNTNTIVASSDWSNTSGFSVVASSAYQSNASFAVDKALDRTTSTYWASGKNTYHSSGNGKLTAFGISPGNQYSGGQSAPLQWTLSGSNSESSLTAIESFGITTWQANTLVEFLMSVVHIPYKFWRITITKVSTTGNSIHVALPDITVVSWWGIGMTSLLSVQPVSTNTFKIILGDANGNLVSMLETPVQWEFNILLSKNGRIVNVELYELSLTRATYLPLDQAAILGERLGFTLDPQLSLDNTTMLVNNRTGQPTIALRGSVTAKDWLVDDVLIAAGSNPETERLRRARQITAAAEAKYKKKSNAVGHSPGGRIAERAGSGGEIVTFNKAAGLGNIRSILMAAISPKTALDRQMCGPNSTLHRPFLVLVEVGRQTRPQL
ncbi:hypothetical protein T492DRAFT_1133956 [Pavlovales sp. CCMP2436]|nr:hypothetical protein T492DRAFT_1133956 [Pavlovales sp. CCMP2436]